VKVIAMGAMVVAVACTDTTAPDATPDLTPVDGKMVPNPAMTSLSGWIADATLWTLDAIPPKAATKIITDKINNLANQLAASKVAESTKAIKDIRIAIGTLTEDEQVDVAPIEVALQTVEVAMGVIPAS
jgi:hypothetical protein